MNTIAEIPSILNNSNPVPDNDLENPVNKEYKAIFQNLQGNILKGHGRDYSTNIFLQFNVEGNELRDKLKSLTENFVTSAYKQLKESSDFIRLKIPGAMFGNLFLSARAYRKMKLGDDLDKLFNDVDNRSNDSVFPQNANFLSGMLAAADDLGDISATLEHVDLTDKTIVNILSPLQKDFLHKKGKLDEAPKLEPLEEAYLSGNIDALLLLADDDENYLLRKVRSVITDLEGDGSVTVLAVELGKALRNQETEGIEHFGYVDGRSQPLFLASDFKDLQNGKIDHQLTTERINEKAIRRENGAVDIWNPFEPLKLILIEDKLSRTPNAFGSYFVFRKLEQDVLRFSMAEQQLADELKLEGSDRERQEPWLLVVSEMVLHSYFRK